MSNKESFVYIMTNNFDTVLYVGMTSNLTQRVNQHKEKHFKGFTQRYNISKLVYYEVFDDINMAIEREKQIKKYSRAKKEKLIDEMNPAWNDLHENLFY
ncbi:TPA: excinuclease ABC subunit C [Candidatus Uhrbacteria bacterium]|nr:excinuclease ABC subunit C [Candidatus Uhrbacteria bacterium]